MGTCDTESESLRLGIESFDMSPVAQVIIEDWRRHYNRMRPHNALGFKRPAPEALHPAPR